jgi:hypothetical protein
MKGIIFLQKVYDMMPYFIQDIAYYKLPTAKDCTKLDKTKKHINMHALTHT